jgi:arylsulfatase
MPCAEDGPQRPNLLLIMADQHRYDWLGAEGAPWVRTPHLDALARRGVRFRQAFCCAPLCAPSRISLAAGLRPHRLGALGNNVFYPRIIPTYYQALRDAGYRVAVVGKLDLHKPDPYNGPRGDRPIVYSYGFTDPVECEGKMHAGTGWPRPHGPYNHYLQERGLLAAFCADYRRRAREPVWYAADSVLPPEDWEDCYIGRRGTDFIRGHRDRQEPWHLFVSFVGPHNPWDPPTPFAAHFREAEMPGPIADTGEGKPPWIQRKMRAQHGATRDQVATVRRQYSAALEAIDQQIGALLAALEETDQADNTYVFYTSDHGEMLGDHGLYEKSVFYEPALRVPLLASGPGIAPGISDALVEVSDLHPTLLELAGVPPPAGLDARCFTPVLRQPGAPHRTCVLSVLAGARCLRTERHKLIESVHEGLELYDLQEDPQELRNVADQESGVCGQLRRTLAKQLI